MGLVPTGVHAGPALALQSRWLLLHQSEGSSPSHRVSSCLQAVLHVQLLPHSLPWTNLKEVQVNLAGLTMTGGANNTSTDFSKKKSKKDTKLLSEINVTRARIIARQLRIPNYGKHVKDSLIPLIR